MRLVDNHTHSCFSTDSRMDIGDAILEACRRGLAGMAFTDHQDFDPPAGVKCFTFDVPEQQKTLRETAEMLSPEDFQVLIGVEIGLQMKSMEKIRSLMSGYTYDTVIASLHLIDGQDPYIGGYYEGKDPHRAYGHYLEEFYECLKVFGDFDILGHYDYIVRYAPYEEDRISYSEYREVADAILKLLVGNGKTFELNTKTYKDYRGRHPRLDLEMLRRFRELGGEALSFGSDAHDLSRIGENFDWCREQALAAGIEYEVFFRERKPVYLKLR